MALYACTIFLGAFLLFLIQPIMAKQILPWFGGSAAVWATCMVFFQVTLLAGYAYADWTTRRMHPRRQAWLHLALLVVGQLVDERPCLLERVVELCEALDEPRPALEQLGELLDAQLPR